MINLNKILLIALVVTFGSSAYAGSSIEGERLNKYIEGFNLGEPCQEGMESIKPCHLLVTNSFNALEAGPHTVFSALDLPVGVNVDELVCKTALTVGGKLAYADISIVKRDKDNFSHIYSNSFHVEKGRHKSELRIACIKEGVESADEYIEMLDHNTVFELKISNIRKLKEIRDFDTLDNRSTLNYKFASI